MRTPSIAEHPHTPNRTGEISGAGAAEAAVIQAASPPAPEDSALPHRGATVAIVGGGLAFFLAGLLLRKGRHLASPA